MNIDMHFTATYAIARLAGFDKQQAHVIAYSSQYVDEAIHKGHILFINHACLEVTPAAHRMLDYRNFEELSNHHVWIPFHFLPGNHFDPENRSVPEMVQRLICKPNSAPAKDLLKVSIHHRNAPYALHLLGTITHTYMDTWAHQNFVGINHKINEVQEILHSNDSQDYEKTSHIQSYYKKNFWQEILERYAPSFINQVAPLGHGPALSYPDHPYLKWNYRNYDGKIIKRDNPQIFMDAVEHLYEFYCHYNKCTQKMHENDRKLIKHIITTTTDHNGEQRMQTWIDYIRTGAFSFGAEYCEFHLEGRESWIYKALRVTAHDELSELFEKCLEFPSEFYKSNWVHLQVGLAIHKNNVLYSILPKYKIVSA